VFQENRFFLLRKRSLGLAPVLHVTVDGRNYKVEVEHHSHAQLVDLRLAALDAEGQVFAVSPSGELVADGSFLARSALMLLSTGARRIELMRGTLPKGARISALTAQLSNPFSTGETPFALVSEPVTVPIGR
jgi:hypothetical protein